MEELTFDSIYQILSDTSSMNLAQMNILGFVLLGSISAFAFFFFLFKGW